MCVLYTCIYSINVGSCIHVYLQSTFSLKKAINNGVCVQLHYLPPVGVILVTNFQNISFLKLEPQRLTGNLFICLGRVVEMCTHIFLVVEGWRGLSMEELSDTVRGRM